MNHSKSPTGANAEPRTRQDSLLRRAMRIWLWLAVAFFCYEIPHDYYEGGMSLELAVEATTVFAMLVLLYAEWERNQRLNDDLGEALADTERAQAGVQRLSGQFSEYVRAAFERWAFSKSEQEIAWLLLKGFPFAEIATLRGVQERTVRQQATAIYAKSGCKNRNEFLACFIEDLLAGDAVPATRPREEAAVE